MDYLKLQNQNTLLYRYLFFDEKITLNLPKNDTRINFIYKNLKKLDDLLLEKFNSKLQVFKGDPIDIINRIVKEYNIKEGLHKS